MSKAYIALQELETYFGPRCTREASERLAYSHDAAAMPSFLWGPGGRPRPGAIVRAESEEDLTWLLRWANEYHVPLTPRARATSAYGGVLPIHGGVVVDLAHCSGIVAIDAQAQTATVRAGTTWQELERALEPYGLATRSYPSSAPASTIGGWLAQGGVGYGAFEFGIARAAVQSARVLLPNSETRTFQEQELDLVAEVQGSTGLILTVTLHLRTLESEGVTGCCFQHPADLAAFLQDLAAAEVPIWSLSFLNPAMASLKNRLPPPPEHLRVVSSTRLELPEAYLVLAVAPARRMEEVESLLQRAASAYHGTRLAPALARQEWNERFNTLQIKRFGPSLIPAEVALPLCNLGPALDDLARTVRQPLAIEGLIARTTRGPEATLLAFIPHDERQWTFNLASALSLTVLNAAKRQGGRACSAGLFFGHEATNILGRERLQALQSFKAQIDPFSIMNPGKFDRPGMLAAWPALTQEFEPLLRPLANAARRRAVGARVAGAPDLKQARTSGLEQIAQNAILCAHCGYCLEGCPQYWGRGWEGQSPRGKWLNLRPGLPHTPEAAERFFACTLCGRCSQVCTVGIEHRAAWLAVRSHLARRGLLPQPLAMLRERLGQQHNIAGLENTSRTAWSENLPASARTALLSAQADVVYFVGCLSSLYPAAYSIAQSLVQLLQGAGLRVATLGAEEWCCGLPLLAAGLPEEARALAQHNLEAVRQLGAGTLVVTCPSCLRAWRDDYPHLIGAKLGLQVRHAVELLPELLAQGDLRLHHPGSAIATYHDPCDLGRALGLYDQPRQLLQAIPGLTLHEMADHGPLALCCGGGGDVEISAPALVATAADRRLTQALATGAQMLISACPQCKRTLTAAVRRAKAPLKVMDVTEVLWQASVSDA